MVLQCVVITLLPAAANTQYIGKNRRDTTDAVQFGTMNRWHRIVGSLQRWQAALFGFVCC